MFRSILLGAVALCAPTIYAQAAPQAVPFPLPSLPYAAGSLEPAIDAQTMTTHHDKHRQAYVDALNKAVVADPGDQ